MEDYRAIADSLAADIAAGRLRPGERLEPQRQFARRRGIAVSTASRVYTELVRRGLVVGEVGRGTYVRAGRPPAEPSLAEPGGLPIALDLNFPVLAGQPAMLADSLRHLLHPEALASALRPVGVAGTPAAREAATALLARAGWAPDPRCLLFAGNGRQAMAAAIAALVPPGGRLGVETLTYPVVKAVANRLGVTLVPLPVDEAGLVPGGLAAACRPTPLHAVYLQPTLHNPLGVTMPEQRRAEVAECLRRMDLHAVEDTVYAFLADDLPPLAALAPERTILVDSLSKRIAPGLTAGFAVGPAGLTDRLSAALRSGGWGGSRFALQAATRWVGDGVTSAVEQAKRRDAAERQQVVRDRLAGFAVRADPRAYHCWWELPEPWRAEAFAAAAARHGIGLTPASAFAVGAGRAPDAVRLALSSPDIRTLAAALDLLAGLARTSPDDLGVE